MDSIAHWLMTGARKKIRMEKPTTYSSRVDFPLHMLNGDFRKKKQSNNAKSRGSDSSGKKEIPASIPAETNQPVNDSTNQ
jgi:hypothetical protein